jgi:hypothetical protein
LYSSIPDFLFALDHPGTVKRLALMRRKCDDARDRQAYDATIAGIFIVLMLVVIVLIFAMS